MNIINSSSNEEDEPPPDKIPQGHYQLQSNLDSYNPLNSALRENNLNLSLDESVDGTSEGDLEKGLRESLMPNSIFDANKKYFNEILLSENPSQTRVLELPFLAFSPASITLDLLPELEIYKIIFGLDEPMY